MESMSDIKKDLIRKSNAIKRTVKEFNYYIKDVENEQKKLKKMEEDKENKGDIKRQSDYVQECEGAKKSTYKTLTKNYGPLEEIINKIETPSQDEEMQKIYEEIKELPEFAEAKEHLSAAKQIIDSEKATYSE
jgi:hypothetical protein